MIDWCLHESWGMARPRLPLAKAQVQRGALSPWGGGNDGSAVDQERSFACWLIRQTDLKAPILKRQHGAFTRRD